MCGGHSLRLRIRVRPTRTLLCYRTTVDIPTEHNRRIIDPTMKFCAEFENATIELGWAESSAYTQTVVLSATRALVCYERQGVCACMYVLLTIPR
jgi:hypothetical protein